MFYLFKVVFIQTEAINGNMCSEVPLIWFIKTGIYFITEHEKIL